MKKTTKFSVRFDVHYKIGTYHTTVIEDENIDNFADKCDRFMSDLTSEIQYGEITSLHRFPIQEITINTMKNSTDRWISFI